MVDSSAAGGAVWWTEPATLHDTARSEVDVAMGKVIPNGIERTFGREEIIVSKTDLNGKITYANSVFLSVSGYSNSEIIGLPHSCIRHPAMPRCVFKLLWDSIERGEEIFAFVNNLAKTGENYWVLAHVTPSFDGAGRVVGYHSNRRSPDRSALNVIEPLYAALLDAERGHFSKQDAIAASTALLNRRLAEMGLSYEAFVFTLCDEAVQ